jgi:hypothetical protein
VPHRFRMSASWRWKAAMLRLAPGIAICLVVAVFAIVNRDGLFWPSIEAHVFAILCGMILRSFWQPSERWQSGSVRSRDYRVRLSKQLAHSDHLMPRALDHSLGNFLSGFGIGLMTIFFRGFHYRISERLRKNQDCANGRPPVGRQLLCGELHR